MLESYSSSGIVAAAMAVGGAAATGFGRFLGGMDVRLAPFFFRKMLKKFIAKNTRSFNSRIERERESLSENC